MGFDKKRIEALLARQKAQKATKPARVAPAACKPALKGIYKSVYPRYRSKAEEQYAWKLEAMKRSGAIAGYYYEAIKLRLANGLYFVPDFLVIMPHGRPQIHEIKRPHRFREKGVIKFKVAAGMYPCFYWSLIED